jgi:hypothetical protein
MESDPDLSSSWYLYCVTLLTCVTSVQAVTEEPWALWDTEEVTGTREKHYVSGAQCLYSFGTHYRMLCISTVRIL